MSRTKRILAATNIYHIMSRGLNKQLLFNDDKDKLDYISFIEKAKKKFKFKIFAYCLMNNHVHLLIYDKDKNISQIMKFINFHYATKFNKKYERIGYVFNNRFLSECIESKDYFFRCIRYIHRNPVNATYANDIYHYQFSSIHGYKSDKGNYLGLVDKEAVLKEFHLQEFLEYNEAENKDRFLDIDNGKMTDFELKKIYEKIYKEIYGQGRACAKGEMESNAINDFNHDVQVEAVKRMLKMKFQLKQIARVSGMSIYMVRKHKNAI